MRQRSYKQETAQPNGLAGMKYSSSIQRGRDRKRHHQKPDGDGAHGNGNGELRWHPFGADYKLL